MTKIDWVTSLDDSQAKLELELLSVVEAVLDMHMINQDELPDGFVIDVTDAVLSYLIRKKLLKNA